MSFEVWSSLQFWKYCLLDVWLVADNSDSSSLFPYLQNLDNNLWKDAEN